MNWPKVSIVILNWNGLEDTIECLESLQKITYPNYEVIIVDNGSTGDDAQVLKEKFGRYIYLIENDRNYGFAGGSNIGIRYALNKSNPDYLLLLNNDTIVDPQFVTEMVKVAESDPAIGITGAKIYSYYNPKLVQFVWGKIDLWKGQTIFTPRMAAERIKEIEIDRGQYDSIREVDWVTGCCFLIKKKALENIGLLDEGYFCYWDDVDYCLRAKRANYKSIYVPTVKVWHKLGQSEKRITGLSCYYGVRNRFRFTKKYATPWQYRCFLVYFFGFYFWIATGYYLILHRSPRLVCSYWKGIKDGLSGSEVPAKLIGVDQPQNQ